MKERGSMDISFVLKTNEMGSLTQIAETLWAEMQKEITRNGHSSLTLALEGSVYGIRDIVELNHLRE